VVVSALAALALGAGLVACETPLRTSATHPDRPDVASLGVESDRVRSGCPVKRRIAFQDAEANVARALASWAHQGSTSAGGRPLRVDQDGFAAGALDRSALTGRRRGEAEIVLTPLQPGVNHYSVQIEDAEGHRRNVIKTSFTVVAQPAGAPLPCSEPVQ
jgi:NAD(P)H-hydrate repair Nnr-like enzyme with NAD(P)H-hydrate dehydratase domain